MRLRVKKGTKIAVEKSRGKVEGFTLLPHEHLEIDLNTGEFDIINKFTDTEVIKYGDTSNGVIQKEFLNRIKGKIGDEFLEV